MCVPLAPVIAGAALAVQVGGAIADHKAQKKQSRATERAARRAQIIERNAISVRQIEEGSAASRRLRDLRLEAEHREGLIAASAGGSGVTGNHVAQLMGDLEGSVGRATVDVMDSYTATLAQLERRKIETDARAQARIEGAPEPSIAATGLRIGGAVTNTLSDYQTLRAAAINAGG